MPSIISESLFIPFLLGEEVPTLKERIAEGEAGIRLKISENFNIRNYGYYDATSLEEREKLYRQTHVDIRSFTGYSGEDWLSGETESKYGANSAVSHYPVLEIKFTNETEVSESNCERSVDIETSFSPESYVIFAMPSVPAGLKRSESYLELTSQVNGEFASKVTEESGKGETVRVPFSTGSPSGTEFRIKRSVIEKNELNLKRITAVRFTVKCTKGQIIYIGGLRLVSTEWGMPRLTLITGD